MKVRLVLPLLEAWPPDITASYHDLRSLAQCAEGRVSIRCGSPNHLLFRRPHEPPTGSWEAWTILSALAQATHHVLLGTMVLSAGFRNPGLLVRYPPLIKPGSRIEALTLLLDIAPTVIEVAGGTPGPHIQGRSLVRLLRDSEPAWRTSFLTEYYGEAAIPWLIAMSYKAARTRGHKYIDWTQYPGFDELYDLDADPYELTNLARDPGHTGLREEMRGELRRLVADAFGL